jgi:ketosteroid isomerase-like protein
MGITRSEVGALYDRQSEAMRAKDLDGLMSLYTSDVIYFDVVPPLQFAGSEALRARFTRWFDGFDGPITMDSRDLNISVNGDIAVAHWFSRASGTLTNGREVGSWVRVTSCCLRSDGGLLITHEHISVPVDLASGRPAADLQP